MCDKKFNDSNNSKTASASCKSVSSDSSSRKTADYKSRICFPQNDLGIVKPVEKNPYKKDFPIFYEDFDNKVLNENIYIDTATTCQRPIQVIDAQSEFYKKYNATVHRSTYELQGIVTEIYENTRVKAAKFINAKSEKEIVYTLNATGAINLVANAILNATLLSKNSVVNNGKSHESQFSENRFALSEGDEIVVTQAEHHSNYLPWKELSDKTGTKLSVIPASEIGEIDTSAPTLEHFITERTKIVAVTFASNVTGIITDVKPVIKRAHEMGAIVVLDACQATPHIKIDVQDLDADFLAFSAHKIYGPTGIGVLYGKYDLLDALPVFQTGGSTVNSVSLEEGVIYKEPPTKFEAGTQMIAEVIGFNACLDYMNNVGIDNIMRIEIPLLKELYKLEDIKGVKILGPGKDYVFTEDGSYTGKKDGLIAFTVDGIHPHDIGQFLDSKHIAVRVGHMCAMPIHNRLGAPVSVRASLGLYNEKRDIDRLLNALEDAIKFFNK